MFKLVLHDNIDIMKIYTDQNDFDFTIDLLRVVQNDATLILSKKDIQNKLSLAKSKYKNKTLHVAPFILNPELINFITNNITYFKSVVFSDFIYTKTNIDDSTELYFKNSKFYSTYVLRENIYMFDGVNEIKFNG